MFLSWLLNSLSKEIAESVLYSKSAKVLWSDLEDRFGQANGAKLFQLQKDLSVATQRNSSIFTYFTNMKSLWDELDDLNTFSACNCKCVCGAKEKCVKAHQDERLLQFLMGLTDTFIGVRSNILLFSPLPTIGQAYSIVISDEKQREIHTTPNYPVDSACFLVGNKGERKFNNYKAQIGIPTKKSNLVCNYCKKTGHTIDQCYKIHGFPADFKFTKTKRYQKGAMVNNVCNTGEGNQHGVEHTTDVMSLSSDNVPQLLQKINQKNTGTTDASANMTCSGMTKFFNSYVCMFKVDSNSWILDSGASEHMTFDRNCFSSLNSLSKPIMVTLPNSQKGPSMKSPLVIGKEQEGLYIFNSSQPVVSRKSPSSTSFPVSAANRQFNSKVKVIRTDNAFELGNRKLHTDFFLSKGYPYGKKGYKVLNLKTKKISISRDVIFHEEYFPYSSKSDPNLVPSTTSLSTDLSSDFPIISSELTHVTSTSCDIPTPCDHEMPSTLVSLHPQNTEYTSIDPISMTDPTHDSLPSYSAESEPVLQTVIRKSSRPHKAPGYLEDYICSSLHLTNVSAPCFLSPVTLESLSFSGLSTINQVLLNSISSIQEPISYIPAAYHPGLQEAMDKELEALRLNNT
ncbi:hypothetical protein KY289_001947 [Solanum tuberosum]|nr:hypothetical protein KY284_001819 [Solanum tuberosum]KAH0730759.1 hypothetical protein KY289_001947 [Solanum tuberosum]